MNFVNVNAILNFKTSTKTECDYLNGWIKKRSHTQKSHPKSGEPQKYSWGTQKTKQNNNNNKKQTDVDPFKPETKQRLFVVDVSIDWATGRRWQTNLVETQKVTQIHLLRRESVNFLWTVFTNSQFYTACRKLLLFSLKRLKHTSLRAECEKEPLTYDNDNNHIQRRNSRIFTISPLRHEPSPTRTLKWLGRNRVQITCNTSSAFHVQHVV